MEILKKCLNIKNYIKTYSLIFLVYLVCLVSFNSDLSVDPENIEKYRAELTEYVRNNIDTIRVEQNERKLHIKKVCQEFVTDKSKDELKNITQSLDLTRNELLKLKTPNFAYIYHAKKQNFIWCGVPKAGSSTWTYNLLKLAGTKTNNATKIHKILRDFYPKPNNKAVFPGTFKFMVVRHPFERILSAYRDKLEDYSRDQEYRDGFYYEHYGKYIAKKYRDPTNDRDAKEPSWREFIAYVIDTPISKFDKHWIPIWTLCSPCNMKYNVIAKMESFAVDTQFILEEGGLDDELQVEWKHHTGTGQSGDLQRDYYGQLSESEMRKVYKKYKLDFELYGYDPQSYYDLAFDA